MSVEADAIDERDDAMSLSANSLLVATVVLYEYATPDGGGRWRRMMG